jgi:hypothetical protein
VSYAREDGLPEGSAIAKTLYYNCRQAVIAACLEIAIKVKKSQRISRAGWDVGGLLDKSSLGLPVVPQANSITVSSAKWECFRAKLGQIQSRHRPQYA